MTIQKDKGNVYDIAKFVAAILVIMIHTQPFENYYLLDKLVGVATRFAVPIFFSLTGLFVFGIKFSRDNLVNYLKHIIFYYLIWSAITAVLEAERYFQLNSLSETLKLLLHDVFHGIGPLWYLPALIYGSIIVGGVFFGRKKDLSTFLLRCY